MKLVHHKYDIMILVIKMDNILEDSNIAFHGINFDYFKMLSILQTGILSQNSAALLGVNIDRNYGGFNGNSQVSLSESI